MRRANFSKKWQKINDRKADRYSRLGREQELLVETILRDAHDADGKPLFFDVTLHKPNSVFDQEGKNFSVSKSYNGIVQTVSFGITISAHQYYEGKRKHRDVPQFCFPIGVNPNKVIKNILDLFLHL